VPPDREGGGEDLEIRLLCDEKGACFDLFSGNYTSTCAPENQKENIITLEMRIAMEICLEWGDEGRSPLHFKGRRRDPRQTLQ